MKKQHSLLTGPSRGLRSVFSSRAPSRRRAPRLNRFAAHLESLESRHVLAANILAELTSSIDTDGGEREVEMQVALPDAAAGSTAVLMVQTMPGSDSSFDPAAVSVRDADGQAVTPISAVDDVDGPLSSTLIELPAGTFTLVFSGDGDAATTGDFIAHISLVGDVGTADGAVDSQEQAQASAALLQAMGAGNFVTAEFYESLGILLSQDQFDSGFDGNGNGLMDGADMAAIDHNLGVGTVEITLQADDEAPVIADLALQNDTGTSDTDGITTDPTITGTITDASEITELLAGLDGTPAFDLLAVLGSADGPFTLTPAILNQIAGGTLSGGQHTLQLTATDVLGNAMSTPASITFTFIANDTAPQVTEIADQDVDQNSAFNLDVTSNFTNNDTGDALTISATLAGGGALPAWLNFNTTTHAFSGTPANDDVGTVSITVTATDTQGNTGSSTFDLTVNDVNDAPIAGDIPNQTATEGQAFSLNVSGFFSDPDVGDTLTLSAALANSGNALPAWLTFTPATGLFSGTPGNGDAGTFSVEVVATDSGGLSDSSTFSITVTGVNDAPVLDTPIPDQSVDQDDNFSLDLSPFFSDADGDTLTFSATADGGNLPAWLSLNGSVLSGTPGNGDVGQLSIAVTARDPSNASASDTFQLTVVNVNDAPVVNNQSFALLADAANGTVVGTVQASDPDVGDTLTFAITGGTGENRFDIDANSGEITLTDNSGLTSGTNFTLTVEVTDSGTPALSDTATITVNISANQPPVANDDSGFSTDDRNSLSIDVADLLANDTDPENDTITVISVGGTSAEGATVTLNGTTITYDPTGADDLIVLHDGEMLVDTFTYTIQDTGGGTDTATVSVTVDGTDDVRFRILTTDANGNEITEIGTGQEFNLVVTVEDVRPNPTSVLTAYLDVTFPDNLVSPNGDIEFIDPYTGATSGDTDTPGLINEAGAFSFNFNVSGENEVIRVPFVAGNTPGTADFVGDETEDQIQHPVTLRQLNTAVDPRMIDFGETSLTITGVAGAASSFAAVPQQNPTNALDVNDDTFVSPLDALWVINALTDATAAGVGYVDVNGDGVVSPMDAILVVNGLGTEAASASSSAPQAAMSSGAVGPGANAASNEPLVAVPSSLGTVDRVFAGLTEEATHESLPADVGTDAAVSDSATRFVVPRTGVGRAAAVTTGSPAATHGGTLDDGTLDLLAAEWGFSSL